MNVNINTSSIDSDRITEVEVDGGATHQSPDPFTAPEISEQESSIETALTALGYAPGTGSTVRNVQSIGTDQTFEEIVTSSHNPIDDSTVVIGDPNDCSTWIAIGSEAVQVDVNQTTTNYTFHRVTVAIVPPCGDSTLDDGEECNDRVVCTALDTCDGAGLCQPGGPAGNCEGSRPKTSLLIVENKAGKKRFAAKLKGGPALLQSDQEIVGGNQSCLNSQISSESLAKRRRSPHRWPLGV